MPIKLSLYILFICGLPLILLHAAHTQGGSATPDDSRAAIQHVIVTQQDAWNRHDLDAFMTGYWNSAQLTFFSGANEHDGWQATMDRYRATYASAGHEMGNLE